MRHALLISLIGLLLSPVLSQAKFISFKNEPAPSAVIEKQKLEILIQKYRLVRFALEMNYSYLRAIDVCLDGPQDRPPFTLAVYAMAGNTLKTELSCDQLRNVLLSEETARNWQKMRKLLAYATTRMLSHEPVKSELVTSPLHFKINPQPAHPFDVIPVAHLPELDRTEIADMMARFDQQSEKLCLSFFAQDGMQTRLIELNMPKETLCDGLLSSDINNPFLAGRYIDNVRRDFAAFARNQRNDLREAAKKEYFRLISDSPWLLLMEGPQITKEKMKAILAIMLKYAEPENQFKSLASASSLRVNEQIGKYLNGGLSLDEQRSLYRTLLPLAGLDFNSQTAMHLQSSQPLTPVSYSQDQEKFRNELSEAMVSIENDFAKKKSRDSRLEIAATLAVVGVCLAPTGRILGIARMLVKPMSCFGAGAPLGMYLLIHSLERIASLYQHLLATGNSEFLMMNIESLSSEEKMAISAALLLPIGATQGLNRLFLIFRHRNLLIRTITHSAR